MTIKHTASMKFYEERDITAAGFPTTWTAFKVNNKAACNWDVERGSLIFEALQEGICIGLSLDNKNTKRKFKLEKLAYGYKDPLDGIQWQPNSFMLYNNINPSEAADRKGQFEYAAWFAEPRKLLGIRLKILALGQV